jgi:hypothetical protein
VKQLRHPIRGEHTIGNLALHCIIVLVLIGGVLGGAWAAQLEPTIRLDSLTAGVLELNSRPPAHPRSGYQPISDESAECGSAGITAFNSVFDDLRLRLGDGMGAPVECARTNAENGDLLQRTSRGLALRRFSSGTVIFTDGQQHWALVRGELVSWSGPGVDPPTRVITPTSIVTHVANTDGEGVVLRVSPRLADRTPRGLVDGARVTILERNGTEWARVRGDNGETGWVPTQYLAP